MSQLHIDEPSNILYQRVHEIHEKIKSHKDNINLLFDFAIGIKNLKNKGYTYGAVCYQRTSQDNDRFFNTIGNLRQQIVSLEYELRYLETKKDNYE